MASAWDAIVNIFKSAINGLIEMLNKIPGVQIDAAFGDMPAAPELPTISAPQVEAPLLPQLPRLRRMTLRGLAEMTGSWDALEMAVGTAAINAHYNRFHLDASLGNGATTFRRAGRRKAVPSRPPPSPGPTAPAARRPPRGTLPMRR